MMKDDLEHEAYCRATFSEERRKEADGLGNAMVALCAGKNVTVLMNVVTSLLVHLYIEHYPNHDLDALLEAVGHNYRMRTKPQGVVPQ